ncbi:hypothetical protein [Mycobacterium camsae]|uniref:hypothetical protein n=1 Tax=Mycobacterium gordonae TaxID=1778 RepID=UPI00198102F0|nr:hypothetical protein [Mycobacterium gordonae]
MSPNEVVYNERPRPRVLLSHVEDATVTEGLIPTVGVMTNGLQGFRGESWDAIISIGSPSGWQAHHYVLQIGGKPAWNWVTFPYGISTRGTLGEEVLLTGEGPAEFRSDLKQVVKTISAQPLPRQVLERPPNEQQIEYFIPLITDADGHVYAAIFHESRGPKEVIYLPEGVELTRRWIALALERWATKEPLAFPAGPEWSHREEWITGAERDAAREVESAQRELDETTERLSRQVAKVEAELQERRRNADANERLILTASDHQLVQAVANSLRQLGFDVEDRDARGARQKMEDLRIRDGGWTAIGEVKGYTGGGSTTDLLKLSRFTQAYQQEVGRFPDAQWYIVNQFRERDPSTRRQLLWGQDEDVEAFAENDGLVIDTRSLFHIARDHAEGRIDADTARALLIQARGRFEYPPPAESSTESTEVLADESAENQASSPPESAGGPNT